MSRITLCEYDPETEDAKRCPVRRGERPTATRCEEPAGHLGEHMGRGKVGQWFIWRTP